MAPPPESIRSDLGSLGLIAAFSHSFRLSTKLGPCTLPEEAAADPKADWLAAEANENGEEGAG
eukprot:scaffold192102_cov36-Prasinocladus_malaysianus.AAC.1